MIEPVLPFPTTPPSSTPSETVEGEFSVFSSILISLSGEAAKVAEELLGEGHGGAGSAPAGDLEEAPPTTPVEDGEAEMPRPGVAPETRPEHVHLPHIVGDPQELAAPIEEKGIELPRPEHTITPVPQPDTDASSESVSTDPSPDVEPAPLERTNEPPLARALGAARADAPVSAGHTRPFEPTTIPSPDPIQTEELGSPTATPEPIAAAERRAVIDTATIATETERPTQKTPPERRQVVDPPVGTIVLDRPARDVPTPTPGRPTPAATVERQPLSRPVERTNDHEWTRSDPIEAPEVDTHVDLRTSDGPEPVGSTRTERLDQVMRPRIARIVQRIESWVRQSENMPPPRQMILRGPQLDGMTIRVSVAQAGLTIEVEGAHGQDLSWIQKVGEELTEHGFDVVDIAEYGEEGERKPWWEEREARRRRRLEREFASKEELMEGETDD